MPKQIVEYNMSLEEVASELGVSRSAVHQIEQRALAKLRRALTARGLGPTALDEEPEEYKPGLFDVNSRTPFLR